MEGAGVLVTGAGNCDGKGGAVHPLAARHDVIVERATGGGRLSRGDAFDDRAMLARRSGEHTALGQGRVAEQMQFVDKPPVHHEELRVAGELDHSVMKRDIGREIGLDVALGGSAFHPVDARGELAYLLGGRRLREPPADEIIEHGAQLVDVVGFLDWNLADEHAAILLEADEARLFQRTESFPHRPARDAQPLGNRCLVQLAAGGKLARQNDALELLLHQGRQGARLHERNGVGAAPGGCRRARARTCRRLAPQRG